MKKLVTVVLLFLFAFCIFSCGGGKESPPPPSSNGSSNGSPNGSPNSGGGGNSGDNSSSLFQPNPLANYNETELRKIVKSKIGEVVETTPPEPDVPEEKSKIKNQKLKFKSIGAGLEILDYIFIDDDTVAVVWNFLVPFGKEYFGGIAVAYYNEGVNGKFYYTEDPQPLWIAILNFVSYQPSEGEIYKEAIWVDKDDGKYFPEEEWEDYEVISDEQIRTAVREKWQNNLKYRLVIFKTMSTQEDLTWWFLKEINLQNETIRAFNLFAGLLNGCASYFTDRFSPIDFKNLPLEILNLFNFSGAPSPNFLSILGEQLLLETGHLIDLKDKNLFTLLNQTKQSKKLYHLSEIKCVLPKIN